MTASRSIQNATATTTAALVEMLAVSYTSTYAGARLTSAIATAVATAGDDSDALHRGAIRWGRGAVAASSDADPRHSSAAHYDRSRSRSRSPAHRNERTTAPAYGRAGETPTVGQVR